jgi:hypothetical protein
MLREAHHVFYVMEMTFRDFKACGPSPFKGREFVLGEARENGRIELYDPLTGTVLRWECQLIGLAKHGELQLDACERKTQTFSHGLCIVFHGRFGLFLTESVRFSVLQNSDGNCSGEITADKGEQRHVVFGLKTGGLYDEIPQPSFGDQVGEEVGQPLTLSAVVDPLQVVFEFLTQDGPRNEIAVGVEEPKLDTSIRCLRKVSYRLIMEQDLQPAAHTSTPASARR